MRLGTHLTTKGQPCDHTPGINPDTLKWSATTSVVAANGTRYYRVHFGPYDAPREQWIRAENIVANPRAKQQFELT